jgi:hypothetical protein
MNTDDLFAPYCDLSGECLVSRARINGGDKPVLNKKLCMAVGIPWEGNKTNSIARWIFFQQNPELDRRITTVLKCGNNQCIRASHIMRGVLNVR